MLNLFRSTSEKNSQISPPKVYLGSFNINGSQLDKRTAQIWLKEASSCDIILLGFQEFPTASIPSSNVRNISDENSQEIKTFLRPNKTFNSSQENQFLSILQEVLGEEFELSGDVSMGENPTYGKVPIGGEKTVEWWGFIRLMCFSRIGLIRPEEMEMFVCPTGIKKSCYGSPSTTKGGDDMGGEAMKGYNEGCSPDKGLVVLYVSKWSLLVINGHLAATNLHNVPEIEFNKKRVEELSRLYKGLWSLVPDLCDAHTILIGDLNFRFSF